MERLLEENPSLWSLFGAVILLQDREECARFFRDLCTVNELEALAERWEIAQLVDRGIPYRQIRDETGASTTTISRIAHWVKYGEGGYRDMLKRIRQENSEEEEA